MSFVADELVKWRDSPAWYDRINLDEFERLAGIGYEPRQIAMYYHVPENDFLWYFNLVGSPLKYIMNVGNCFNGPKRGWPWPPVRRPVTM